MVNILKQRRKRLRTRKETLLKKLHKIAILCDVDVAFFLRVRETGRIITFNSLDVESWPPSRGEMKCVYPIPQNFLPQDIEAKFGKIS
ncbi:hypothetical protein BJ878DRAFT_249809 [Calycina marina]|uniref:MADS-box domain-containing protein n=1 Tax=Calycina marina TaxID=1763456 RepID=A0A9P7YXT1_9HELO|nr:hypothetical protein BJ878DRAFT_249809 [Calycina marina]